jgi:hypothetical protein
VVVDSGVSTRMQAAKFACVGAMRDSVRAARRAEPARGQTSPRPSAGRAARATSDTW